MLETTKSHVLVLRLVRMTLAGRRQVPLPLWALIVCRAATRAPEVQPESSIPSCSFTSLNHGQFL